MIWQSGIRDIRRRQQECAGPRIMPLRFHRQSSTKKDARASNSVNWTLPLLLLLVGCASPCKVGLTSRPPFDFGKDTFAFPNELTWTYEYEPQGHWTTHTRKPKPDYSQHCFVLARTTLQFYLNARFDASQPVADESTYRRLIRRVVSSSPRKSLADSEKIIFPGYPSLRSFSQAEQNMLKAECGGAWRSYVQRGHWRVVFPFTRRHQQNTANKLLVEIPKGAPLVVHLTRFPQLTINHALVIFAAERDDREIRFLTYDPNLPTEPRVLKFDRATRTFLFGPNDYFPGGRVDVYQVYHKWNY